MANWSARTAHLPSYGQAVRAREQRRYFGGDVSPGVEMRRGRNGSVVYALKQGIPVESDPAAELIAELEAQRRARTQQ